MPFQKKDFSKQIMGYALKNAIDYGKADAGKILPKLFQHGLQREQIKEVMPEIILTIKDVNELSEKDRILALKPYIPHLKFRDEEDKSLTHLPNPSKKMVFRLAPFPSGALHLGNAKTYLLNAIYAEHYKAKILLVMDDTIGSVDKPLHKESYKLIKEAFDILGVKYVKPEIYKSDRLEIYYDYAQKLISKGVAYVCHCSVEEVRKKRISGIACSCREYPSKIQLARWKDMFTLDPGEAVLRIKTNMLDRNPAFRDRILFKISDRPHPRRGKKYTVWPSLEMSWAIDDYELGVTHIIRGNELRMETQMEKFIWDIFGWKHPEVMHTGLISAKGAKMSKSKAQKEVESGQYTGWEDPRTWSIQSLARRGITAKGIRDFVEEIGLNKQDITVPIDNLYAANRRIIDSKSPRYYFVESPVELTLSGDLPNEVEVPIHPDTPEKIRKLKINPAVLISKEDFDKYQGKEVRLLHLVNIKFNSSGEARVTSIENKKIPKIQWVSNPTPTQILMPDGSWVEGVSEPAITKLKVDDTIQFERFGFVRYDSRHKDVRKFWFAHR